MITEDYVSFEVAKLLKEKEFDGKCDKCYAYFADDDIRIMDLKYPKSAQLLIEDRFPCVTLQMACRWLTAVHNLFITFELDFSDGAYPMFDAVVYNLATCEKYPIINYDRYSYIKGTEAAIKYCLKNLI